MIFGKQGITTTQSPRVWLRISLNNFGALLKALHLVPHGTRSLVNCGALTYVVSLFTFYSNLGIMAFAFFCCGTINGILISG